MDWINLYGPRRGTNFVYYYLSQHSNITPTKEKEPLNFDYESHINFIPKYYRSVLIKKLKPNTKYILDGSASFIHYDEFLKINEFLKEVDMGKPYLIYMFRDPFKMLKSGLLCYLMNHFNNDPMNMANGTWRWYSIKRLEIVEKVIPRNRIYFCYIETFNEDLDNLFKFLNLEKEPLDIEGIYKNTKYDVFKTNPEIKESYEKMTPLINRSNPDLNWVYDDLKSVDEKYGTNLIERYF
jgi:hypothetical protein